jgi:hypothetical protein
MLAGKPMLGKKIAHAHPSWEGHQDRPSMP